MQDVEVIDLDGGKYRVICNNGVIKVERYREEWRDCSGDNLIYWLVVEITNLRAKLKEISNASNTD